MQTGQAYTIWKQQSPGFFDDICYTKIIAHKGFMSLDGVP